MPKMTKAQMRKRMAEAQGKLMKVALIGQNSPPFWTATDINKMFKMNEHFTQLIKKLK